MHKLFFALCLTLSACVSSSPEATLGKFRPVTPAKPCEGAGGNICTFVNAPVQLLSNIIRLQARPLPFFRTAHSIEFVDAKPVKWLAPPNTLTDGASIPKIFMRAVGNPRSKEFLNAATLHDAYCGIGNEDLPQYHSQKWQNVHRMFYDALRVNGTPPTKAKIMYAAVYLGGPRWYMLGEKPKAKIFPGLIVITAPVVAGPTNRPLQKIIPEEMLLTEMTAAIAFIKGTNPSFRRLEKYLEKREQAMFAALNLDQNGDNPEGPATEASVSDPAYN